MPKESEPPTYSRRQDELEYISVSVRDGVKDAH